MSHIDNVTPAGPVTLTTGQSVDVDVAVSGVPADVTGHLAVTGSDGTAASVVLVLDQPSLAAVVGGTAALLPHQIRVDLSGFPGVVTVVGPVAGGIRVRVSAT